MKTIPEIKKALRAVRLEEKELETELSKRMEIVIEKELEAINSEFGAYPSSIKVDFMNTSIIGDPSDHYIMRGVYVKI